GRVIFGNQALAVNRDQRSPHWTVECGRLTINASAKRVAPRGRGGGSHHKPAQRIEPLSAPSDARSASNGACPRDELKGPNSNMNLVRDTWLIFERSVALTLRNPAWVVIGLVQPLFFLLLFGPLLQPLTQVPGFSNGASAFNVFVPGLLIQLGLFG